MNIILFVSPDRIIDTCLVVYYVIPVSKLHVAFYTILARSISLPFVVRFNLRIMVTYTVYHIHRVLTHTFAKVLVYIGGALRDWWDSMSHDTATLLPLLYESCNVVQCNVIIIIIMCHL